jgi:hypothetical protein
MLMNSDTWTRASALFDELYELNEDEQKSYLIKLKQSDPQLHAKLLEIVRFSHVENPFMPYGVLQGYPDFMEDFVGEAEEPEPMEGRLVGSYRILKQIGSAEGVIGTFAAELVTRNQPKVIVN